VGLSNTPYHDALDVAIAALGGFVVQFMGWCLAVPILLFVRPESELLAKAAVLEAERLERETHALPPAREWAGYAFGCIVVIISGIVLLAASLGVVLVPIAAVYYTLYRYLNWIGPGQGHVTIAFAGGLLLKAFLIPLIKTIASGIGLLWLKTFLRGKKTST
jgi:hypothetical protein